MSLTRAEIATHAEALYAARLSRKAIKPLSEDAAGLTLLDAYKISDLNLRRRLAEEKTKLIGKKIGLTSRAVQKQLGVDQPDFGYLTANMNVALGDSVSMSKLMQPKVEGEVAFVLKRDLAGPHLTAADVIKATDFILPCIEIIDSRIKDWKIKVEDTIADNASSALYVLGSQPKRLGDYDLRMAGMVLRKNNEVESTGVGMACMEHPINALLWLANQMGSLGEKLRAGEIILTGAFGPVVSVVANDHIEVEIQGLGAVNCRFKE